MNLSQCREGQELPESRGGDFTIFTFVASLDRDELGQRMGFHPGRLGRGAVIAVMSAESLAVLTTSDFRSAPRPGGPGPGPARRGCPRSRSRSATENA